MKVFSLILILCVLTQTTSAKAQGHTHDILEVKFNADATKLLSYSAGDGWLILWEVKSGRVLWRTKTSAVQKGNEYYTLTSFTFNPSENLIASGSGNGTVQLWDAQTGRLLWRADAHKDSVTAVEFSPDGKHLAAAASPTEGKNEIKILRVEDGQISKDLESNSCVAIAITFAEDGKVLRAGNLGGMVTQWDVETGKRNDSSPALPCRALRNYEWETSFTPDLKHSATRTGEKEVTLKTTQSNTDWKKFEAGGYRIYSSLSADGQKLVISGYGGFVFYDLATGATRKIEEFSRTGSTIDLSRDGTLFAEGGSWGNAAIKITETNTGKSHLLNGQGQHLSPYQASELESRLTKEKEQRQALLKAAQAHRDKQAVIDTAKFSKQVYISFEHYGDMTDPGKLRLAESDVPNKSKVKKPATGASAVWLRLHNDSSLPIKVPTQSMYLPNPKCFYQYANSKKLLGLCDNREISIWHGLEDKRGKTIPYGFDFGSSSVLLPHTSAVFAVPLELLKNEQAIHFRYVFLKETDENKIEAYGAEFILKFRQTDLRSEK